MADDDGFLSRWSRRKVQVRQGGLRADEATPAPNLLREPVAEPSALQVRPAPARSQPQAQAQEQPQTEPQPADAQALPPSLSDVATLTHESDFTRFVTPQVPGEVRNAALKKLFTDPHFNVMDGLDTYIDDYNKADPLPASMLRQMAQAAYLGLVEPEPEEASAQAPAPRPMTALEQPGDPFPNDCATGDVPVAMSPAAASEAAVMKPHDEDPDLRLQSLHDPGPPGAEPGLGGHAGGQR